MMRGAVWWPACHFSFGMCGTRCWRGWARAPSVFVLCIDDLGIVVGGHVEGYAYILIADEAAEAKKLRTVHTYTSGGEMAFSCRQL